jgi:anti-sigma B factor antagonist
MVLVVSDKLTVATVVQAKARLMVALESGESLELDARGVSEVDVAGLQVLLAAKREAATRGHTFSLPVSSRSEPLVQALALAGLTDALNEQSPEIGHG